MKVLLPIAYILCIVVLFIHIYGVSTFWLITSITVLFAVIMFVIINIIMIKYILDDTKSSRYNSSRFKRL